VISIEKSHKTYPNHPTRAFLLALEDVLGKNGVNALLRIANLQGWIDTYPAENFEREVDLSEFSSINAALVEIYGPRGGYGLARRASKSAFDLTWKQHGALGDLQTAAFDSFRRRIISFYFESRIAQFAGDERALHLTVRDLLVYLKAVCNGWVLG
jgi:hypothetical protein